VIPGIECSVTRGVAINYTTKTQYLFRINKGIENHWDNKAINKYMPGGSRPIPFERMIFLGDGDTDIPTMKMLTYQGGHSIAVYDEQREQKDLDKIHGLISDDRVDFVAPANYEENSQLDIIVKGILGRIAHKLRERSIRDLSAFSRQKPSNVKHQGSSFPSVGQR